MKLRFETLILHLGVILLLWQNGSDVMGKKFYIPSHRTNWFKAVEFCSSVGMKLASIESRAENDEIAKFVQTTDKFNDVGCAFWIGGSDLGEEGSFTWIGTGRLVTFSHWSPGEPNNANQTEHCMQLVYIPRFNQKWTWNDNGCTNRHMFFICEGTECVSEFK
ncbi:C-type lectin 37Da-like [Uranotaenia lowii]|uniref:C-type lectin 37Da-like n=1 Tax=Uranotaenia lowii TaxID=190385 RepID=UPI002478B1C0|nr:C-type lectin 37Da-like [Uranotaenia lowii]